MCSCIFILIINFSPVIVLHSYSPLHHHRRYRVCILSGLCTKIVTSNVDMFNELAVHHDCVPFPYYVLNIRKKDFNIRSFYFAIYLMANSLNLNSLSISEVFYNLSQKMRSSYNKCACNGISVMKNFYI